MYECTCMWYAPVRCVWAYMLIRVNVCVCARTCMWYNLSEGKGLILCTRKHKTLKYMDWQYSFKLQTLTVLGWEFQSHFLTVESRRADFLFLEQRVLEPTLQPNANIRAMRTVTAEAPVRTLQTKPLAKWGVQELSVRRACIAGPALWSYTEGRCCDHYFRAQLNSCNLCLRCRALETWPHARQRSILPRKKVSRSLTVLRQGFTELLRLGSNLPSSCRGPSKQLTSRHLV